MEYERSTLTTLYKAPQLVFPEPVAVRHYPRVELTKPQKTWIKERDENECQFPLSHICYGIINLHHIINMGWAQSIEGLLPAEFNAPENILTVCQNIHTGFPDISPDKNLIHPDHRHALMDYRQGDKEAFSKVGRQHQRLMSVGLRYWFSKNDDLLQEVVQERMYKMRHMAPYPKGRRE